MIPHDSMYSLTGACAIDRAIGLFEAFTKILFTSWAEDLTNHFFNHAADRVAWLVAH